MYDFSGFGNTIKGCNILGKANILRTAVLPISDRFHFFPATQTLFHSVYEWF